MDISLTDLSIRLSTLEQRMSTITTPSQYEQVKLFTSESMGKPLPTKPRPMTLEEAKFLFKMKFSEAAEFFGSFTTDQKQIMRWLLECLEGGFKDLQPIKECTTDAQRIAAQGDALWDDTYYGFNAASKCCFPMDEFFVEIQRANMDKKFPDGTFHKREDGKVIKPPGWKERDLVGIVEKKLKE